MRLPSGAHRRPPASRAFHGNDDELPGARGTGAGGGREMRDPRTENLAKILVGYSTEVQPGEIVSVEGDVGAAPLLHAVYEKVLEAGAHPILNVALDGVAA